MRAAPKYPLYTPTNVIISSSLFVGIGKMDQDMGDFCHCQLEKIGVVIVGGIWVMGSSHGCVIIEFGLSKRDESVRS